MSHAMSREGRPPCLRPVRAGLGERVATGGRPYRRVRVVLVVLLLSSAAVVLAQSAGGYDLSWSTVDGGGWTFSTGGGYSLGGTAGQPDAGLMSSSSYTLVGGFWPGGVGSPEPQHSLYLPLVVRSH